MTKASESAFTAHLSDQCAETESGPSWRVAMGPERNPSPFSNQASAYGQGFREGMKYRFDALVARPCQNCGGHTPEYWAKHAAPPSGSVAAPSPVEPRGSLNEFHRINFGRQYEAFAPPHSLTALVVCVQEEVGELAAAVLGYTGEKKRKAHLTRDDVLDAVADAMTYLSLVASNVGCFDLEELLGRTFNMVSARAGSKLTTSLGAAQPEQAPQAEATPPEADDRCIQCADSATKCREQMCCVGCNHRGIGPISRKYPDDVIRAAEGVALEPGEYETVAHMSDGKSFRFYIPERSYFATAVRRVAPESAAKPPAEVYVPEWGDRVRVVEVAERDRSAVLRVGEEGVIADVSAGFSGYWNEAYTLVTLVGRPNLGTWCRVAPAPLTEPEPVPESGGVLDVPAKATGEVREYCERLRASLADRNAFCLRGAELLERDEKLIAELTKERDDLRSKVSELEAKTLNLDSGLSKLKEQYDGACEANARLTRAWHDLRSTLTATGAKLEAAETERDSMCQSFESARAEVSALKADLGEIGLAENEAGSCDTPEGAAAEARVKAQLATRNAELEAAKARRDDYEKALEAERRHASEVGAQRDEHFAELARVRGELAEARSMLGIGFIGKVGSCSSPSFAYSAEPANQGQTQPVDSAARAPSGSSRIGDASVRLTGPENSFDETPAVAAPAVVHREIVVESTWARNWRNNVTVVVEAVDSEVWVGGKGYGPDMFRSEHTWVSNPPAPPTAIPRGTTLEVGSWYEITSIAEYDENPRHKVGDLLQCLAMVNGRLPGNALSVASFGGTRGYWFASPQDEFGGTYVTGLELVPGPVKEQA